MCSIGELLKFLESGRTKERGEESAICVSVWCVVWSTQLISYITRLWLARSLEREELTFRRIYRGDFRLSPGIKASCHASGNRTIIPPVLYLISVHTLSYTADPEVIVSIRPHPLPKRYWKYVLITVACQQCMYVIQVPRLLRLDSVEVSRYTYKNKKHMHKNERYFTGFPVISVVPL